MTLALRFAARSDVGLLRDGNEDSMYAGPRLLAVADGMGGHAAGEVASRVVVEAVAVLDTEPPPADLTSALREAVVGANDRLRDMVAADPALEGMGTTLTTLLWIDQQLALGHIGDSRAYLLRDGRLELVTHDHTLVQNLIDEGRIRADEASTHPQRSWITRALDGRPDVELDLSVREPRAGDRYLICSDGLSSYVSEETIAEALATPDRSQACDRLVELALRAGGPDNITCIVADLVEEPAGSDEPVIGGAAADHATSTGATDSPAARAAAIGGRAGAPAPPAPDAAAPAPGATAEPVAATAAIPTARHRADDDEVAGRGSARRVLFVIGGVVVLAALAVLGTFLYVRTQFYVGVAAGPPQTVAVYRGVTGSVLGVDLSRVADQSNLPVTALPDYERPRVAAGIPASSHDDARRIVGNLRTEACPSPTPRPTPSGRHHKPAPTPTPSPYCTGVS